MLGIGWFLLINIDIDIHRWWLLHCCLRISITYTVIMNWNWFISNLIDNKKRVFFIQDIQKCFGCSGFGNCWTDWLQKSDKTGGQPINNHEIKHCAISNMLQNICQLVHSQEHYKFKGELQIKLSPVTHSVHNVKSIYIENKVQKAFWTSCHFPTT